LAEPDSSKRKQSTRHRESPLVTPNDLADNASQDIAGSMNGILADVFAIYLKTKNFHWHMSGPHFRDYHLLLDEQADQLYAMTDPIAERIRKTGGSTLRSIGHIARINGSRITMQNTSILSICLPSCARTIRPWPPACVRCTRSSMSTATSRRRA